MLPTLEDMSDLQPVQHPFDVWIVTKAKWQRRSTVAAFETEESARGFAERHNEALNSPTPGALWRVESVNVNRG